MQPGSAGPVMPAMMRELFSLWMPHAAACLAPCDTSTPSCVALKAA